MISKQMKSVLAIGLSLTLISCTDFLRGKPVKKDTVELKKESISCLKSVSTQFKTFLRSEATLTEIDDTFTCLDSTLNEFQTRVEGRAEADAFTTDEIFEIFTKFLSDADISREAANDLVLIKTAILGGSAQKITKLEIAQLRAFLVALKPEVKALLPYAKVFNFKKDVKTANVFAKDYLRVAFSQLNVSLKNMLKLTRFARSNYQFEDFKRLLVHLKVVDSDKNEFLDLATKVRNLLIGKVAVQSDEDFSLFVDNLTEVLRLYALQIQGSVKFGISTPAAMTDSIDYLESWLNLLENSVQYKSKKTIALDTFDPLVFEIANQGVLSVKVKGETLVDFYKLIVMRAFDSGRTGDVNKLSELTHFHFVNVRREVAIYKLYMKFIDNITDGAIRISIVGAQNQIKAFDPSKEANLLKGFDHKDQNKILRAFDELRFEFLQARPVVYRFKKMVIAANQEIWDQSWEDLARGFYGKMLARELMIGWGITPISKENPAGANSKEVSQAYLTEESLVQWYAEFKRFGDEARFLDPRSINSGSESFKQADLLTYAGDGDGKLNYLETVQYINIIVSGSQTLKEIRGGFAAAGCNLKEIDAFGNPWNNEECALKELRKNAKYYFSNLSWLAGYMERLNEVDFKEFYLALMDLTRNDDKYKGVQIETGDLRPMSIMLHFIEAIFAVYDKDRNWTFSTTEILEAYPRFKVFARKYAQESAQEQLTKFNSRAARIVYSCYDEEDLVKNSFVFLLFEGHKPVEKDLASFPCFFSKRLRPLIDFSAKKEVDRRKILNTFKILKDALGLHQKR